jgi:hypothetical protein
VYNALVSSINTSTYSHFFFPLSFLYFILHHPSFTTKETPFPSLKMKFTLAATALSLATAVSAISPYCNKFYTGKYEQSKLKKKSFD